MYQQDELLYGIRDSNSKVITYIYKQWFQSIHDYIVKNAGLTEDAEDIFQDALVIIYEKILNNNLILNCSFHTYLFSICRHLWLQRLEKKNTKNIVNVPVDQTFELQEELRNNLSEYEKDKLFHKHFNQLQELCKKLLRLSLDKVPSESILKIMGFSSISYMRKRKALCKKTLLNWITRDPMFAIIKEDLATR